MSSDLDWDVAKAAANLRKHSVSLTPWHSVVSIGSKGEKGRHWQKLGSVEGVQLLLVVYPAH